MIPIIQDQITYLRKDQYLMFTSIVFRCVIWNPYSLMNISYVGYFQLVGSNDWIIFHNEILHLNNKIQNITDTALYRVPFGQFNSCSLNATDIYMQIEYYRCSQD